MQINYGIQLCIGEYDAKESVNYILYNYNIIYIYMYNICITKKTVRYILTPVSQTKL